MLALDIGARIFAGVLFLAVIAGAGALGGRLSFLADFYSFLFVFLGGSALWVAAHGISGIFTVAAGLLQDCTAAEMKEAATIANTGVRQFERIGWMGFFVGMISLMSGFDDPSVFGPAFAVALLCPLYGYIISSLFMRSLADHFSASAQKCASGKSPG